MAIINSQMDTINSTLDTLEDDLVALRPLIKELKTTLDATLFTESGSGVVASFDDGANNVPVRSLSVAITPIQTGTGDPSPTNIRPISGHTEVNVVRTGKNLLSGIYAGQISSTTGQESTGTLPICAPIKVKPSTAYTLSPTATNGAVRFFEYDANGNFIKTATASGTAITGGYKVTYTTSATTAYLRFQSTATIIPFDGSYQLEEGSTATTYEPFGQTYPISLGQTVYGGTLNVTTGELMVEYAKKTMTGTGSNQGTSFAGKASVSNVDGYYAQFYESNGAANIPLSDVKSHIRCSQAKVVNYADAADEARAGTVVFTWSTTTSTPVRIQPRIYFPTSLGIDTEAKANQFLADQYAAGTPVEYIYKLATPLTVQLTPTEVTTLLGVNNIWADTGDITEVTIRCDTALYIQKLVG